VALALGVDEDLGRVALVADDRDALLLGSLDLDAFLVGAVTDADLVAGAGGVDRLLNRLVLATLLADLQRLRAAGTRLRGARVGGRRVVGGKRQCGKYERRGGRDDKGTHQGLHLGLSPPFVAALFNRLLGILP